MAILKLVESTPLNSSNFLGISLYTDGACSGNPGPGGWGVLLIDAQGNKIELSGSEAMTTNNRMELMAAIKGLESITTSENIALYTDSLYLRDGMTKWMLKWKVNNWHDAINRKIKNLDLWQRLDQLAQQLKIEWHWVRGHSGHDENERADFLARNAIVQYMMQNDCS